ncbi:hypothetical protein HNP84_006821 [Thermocatellispora tengchongensis]|uniref:Uncharacterized protein n=1 Tax=Thermocatellispora tengchongensis TaxID=1073253 RepID=A0A840PDK2_9ACTN|nr:hypothetical protein [Thermocatellispora tengchongensis]MBB5137069.1 hypothetical protein [Thermocatellispora tengchongensis]
MVRQVHDQVAAGDSPGRAFSFQELAGDPGAAPAEAREAISCLNRIAEASGFVPLIKDTSAEVSVDPETAAVARHALDELERMGS